MRHQLYQTTLATVFTLSLFSVSQTPVHAAPGTLGQKPLFVAVPTPPNIFFMLDDSGSMHWLLPSDGVSSDALISRTYYDIDDPDTDNEWFAWCLGANFMAYNPAVTYKPWPANKPGTSTPFPDQTNLGDVQADPLVVSTLNTGTDEISGNFQRHYDLSNAPVVLWTDDDNDGEYDAGECANSYTDNPRGRVKKASTLSAAEKINFANWFSYYRIREHATKAAVTQVISTSSARMGMSTLHNNGGDGIEIKDMTVIANKDALLDGIVQINSSNGTPLRTKLDQVGEYFDQASATPGGLDLAAGVTSPILPQANGGECQQNFTMLMTDGQWNGGSPGVGNEDGTIDNNFVHSAHQDGEPDTLADVAMKWYKKDLSTTLANKVPIQTGDNTLNLDENTQQHMVTFGVAFGATGNLTSNPVDRNNTFIWPTPAANDARTLDDLRHAAYNGRGQFLSANNPEALSNALQTVILDIESRQGSASAVSFNTTSLASNTSVFFASFNTANWTGNLRAFDIDPVTGVIAASPFWAADSLLDAKTDADMLNRVIYTTGLDSTGNTDGVLFNYNASTPNPNPALVILTDLQQNPDGSPDTTPFTNSLNRLNFLRGDTTNEGLGLIRNRVSRLGDIVNSAPNFVGHPLSNWSDADPFGISTARYSSYQTTLTTTPRNEVVYVGANDGLLHGFDAITGQEVFAYVPGEIASSSNNAGLHYLTESDYNHRYYVDGVPISTDIYMKADPTDSAATWKTLLIGTLGGGGHGLYALDVTDPSQFVNTQAAAEKVVLWEFTDQDDADLGYTYSAPQITMMNNDQWAVIVGNGYNASGTDNAKLFIIFIEKGIDGAWTAGDYIKLDTGAPTITDKNGLSTPTLLDLNNDGVTDRIYAGDLHGNLWAFDVSDPVSTNWKIAHNDGTATPAPTPLFSAGTTKPITMKPLVVKPATTTVVDDATNTPNYMVYFGTGQYLATGDASTTTQQSFYAVWDAGGIEVPASQLVQQTFLSGFPANTRVLSQNSVTLPSPPTVPSTAGTELGWYIDLALGERVTVDAFTLAELIFFNTLTPKTAPCTGGGNSFQMAVDLTTGGNPTFAAFDITGDRILDASDQVINGGVPFYAAGVDLGLGIASATSVITNQISGLTVGVTSFTNDNKPHDSVLPCPTAPCGVNPPGPPAPPVPSGLRKAWKQLFN